MPIARPIAGGRTASLTAGVIAGSLLLAGCSASSPAATTPADSTPTAGGSLTFAIGSDQACIDPQQVGSTDSILFTRQIVDSLTDQNPDTGEIVPWLAKSWEVNSDASEFTFTLAPGATFSDGEAVDAQAVKDNFDALLALGPRAQLAGGYVGGYKASTVIDDSTVKIAFNGPNAQFLQATSTVSLGLLSPATVAKTADERCTEASGSGPFVVKSYKPNETVSLVKRADYGWGSSLWTHDGAAYLDSLTFKVIPESGVRTGSLRSGSVQGIGNIGPQDEVELSTAGIQLPARTVPGTALTLALNQSREIFADPAVRSAISHAVNRQEVVDTAFTSPTRIATSILSDSTPYYSDLSAHLGFDPAESASQLESAGWERGDDGIYAKNGQQLSFDIVWLTNYPTNKAAVELIQQQLKAAGIKANLRETPVENAVAILKSGDFDIVWGNGPRTDPDILRTLYSATLSNFYRFPDGTELQAALQAQAAEPDPTKRAELATTAQKLIVENYLLIPVVQQTMVVGITPEVHGLNYEASSRLQFFDAWISK